FGWLSRSRRMSKDYEREVQMSETFLEGAMIRLRISRLGNQVSSWLSSPFPASSLREVKVPVIALHELVLGIRGRAFLNQGESQLRQSALEGALSTEGKACTQGYHPICLFNLEIVERGVEMPPHGTTLGAPHERLPGTRASGGLVSIGAYQGKPPASAVGKVNRLPNTL